MSFRLAPISVTLNNLERRNGQSLMSIVSVWAIVSYDRWPNNIKVCVSLCDVSDSVHYSRRSLQFEML